MTKRTTALAVGLAKRLKQKRVERDMTLRDLGEKAGVSHSTILLWEQNRGGRAGIDAVEALARALGVTPCWLAYGAEKEEEGKS